MEAELPSPTGWQDAWSIYKIPIILGVISIFCITISLFIFIKSYQNTTPIQFSSGEGQASVAGVVGTAEGILVDVEGAVVRPGVYHLAAGSRIDDAITAAGGLSREADVVALARSVNRAAKLTDGGKLWVPLKEKDTTPIAGASGSLTSSGFVSVNLASQSDLEALVGIGQVTAKKIIDNRPYQTLEELVTKKVLSQSLFDKLKDQLTL